MIEKREGIIKDEKVRRERMKKEIENWDRVEKREVKRDIERRRDNKKEGWIWKLKNCDPYN